MTPPSALSQHKAEFSIIKLPLAEIYSECSESFTLLHHSKYSQHANTHLILKYPCTTNTYVTERVLKRTDRPAYCY